MQVLAQDMCQLDRCNNIHHWIHHTSLLTSPLKLIISILAFQLYHRAVKVLLSWPFLLCFWRKMSISLLKINTGISTRLQKTPHNNRLTSTQWQRRFGPVRGCDASSVLWRSHSWNCDIPSHLFTASRNQKTLFNDDAISSQIICLGDWGWSTHSIICQPMVVFYPSELSNLISQHSTGATLNCVTGFERAHSKGPHPAMSCDLK